MSEPRNSWERFVPWYLTLISAFVLVGIGWFLVDHISWLRGHMFDPATDENLSYRSHQYFLLVSTMRRSAGLFAGISIVLLGIGVVFYVARDRSKLDVSWGGVTLGIVTASPGIIAMALGTFLIAHNTASKDVVPIYGGSITAGQDVRDTVQETDDLFNRIKQSESGDTSEEGEQP
ncbi:MAG: hypothetical protein AAFU41_06520 [Pseudomonadota bacterium]